jgi:antirestriction protein ArdC
MKTSRKDINQMITDRIIERIKITGLLPWKKPWKSPNEVPRSLITHKPYRGVNAFLLHAMGYASPCWLTMNQVNALGGKVRKGEHACPVVFWKFLDEVADTPDTPGPAKRYALLRYYSVFNTEQCEGLPKDKLPSIVTNEAFCRLDEAERLINEMPDPPTIRHDSRKASYSPQLDTVRMPPRACFHSEAGYYDAIFHELTHAVGHVKRLNRKGLMERQEFGSDEYSQEELVAEMGSAFLCGHCGILTETVDNTAAYLKHWLEKLKADPSLLVRAGSQAQKAYDYITGCEIPINQNGLPLTGVVHTLGKEAYDNGPGDD